jgi:hypothetical protein
MIEIQQTHTAPENNGFITSDADEVFRNSPETLARILAIVKKFPGSFAFGHDFTEFKQTDGNIINRVEERIDPHDPALSHIELARRQHHDRVVQYLDELAISFGVSEIIVYAFDGHRFGYTDYDREVMSQSAQVRLMAGLNRDYLLHCPDYQPQTPYEEMLREMQKSHFIVGSSACSGAVLTTDAL